MKLWAERAHRDDIQFCFFMAVEDAVTLRSRDDGSFSAFGEGVKALAAAGSEFHPHNHCLFDPETGERPGLASGFPPRIPGYPKRPSMFYDVVHRHGVAFKEWLPVLVRSFDEILPSMAVTRPSALAFRAGGSDSGGTADDLAEYVAALAASGIRLRQHGIGRGLRNTQLAGGCAIRPERPRYRDSRDRCDRFRQLRAVALDHQMGGWRADDALVVAAAPPGWAARHGDPLRSSLPCRSW